MRKVWFKQTVTADSSTEPFHQDYRSCRSYACEGQALYSHLGRCRAFASWACFGLGLSSSVKFLIVSCHRQQGYAGSSMISQHHLVQDFHLWQRSSCPGEASKEPVHLGAASEYEPRFFDVLSERSPGGRLTKCFDGHVRLASPDWFGGRLLTCHAKSLCA